MANFTFQNRPDWPLPQPMRNRSVSPVRPNDALADSQRSDALLRRAASARHPRRAGRELPPLAKVPIESNIEEDDLVISDIDDNDDDDDDTNSRKKAALAQPIEDEDHHSDAFAVRRSTYLDDAQLQSADIPTHSPKTPRQKDKQRASDSLVRSDISSSSVLASPDKHRESIVSPRRESVTQPVVVNPPKPGEVEDDTHLFEPPAVNGHARTTSEEEESRDRPTAIRTANLRQGSLTASDASSSPSSPAGTTKPIKPSILKDPIPSAPGSRRHSQQMNHGRDRVRYSWQSAQENDEPNRPRIHIIKLISNTTSASAGFPGGEALSFSISTGGRRIAAYNSARLYVLQTAALPVGISQDYSIKRRPVAVQVLDEGNVMAILSDVHTVNVYDLGHQKLRLKRSIKLDFPANCIALNPTGGLLAAGYEGGVEVFSLDEDALATDRRAVRSTKVDSITFSDDSSTLLGTTTRINASATVMISVPVFPSATNNVPTPGELKEAWCGELLHPENIRNSSHATFMRANRSTCSDQVFAWNGLADTFGVLNVQDMQYGNIDFPVVISPPLSTCGGLGAAIHSCPAIDEYGATVAMIVNDRTVRLYIVPTKPEDNNAIEAHSIDHELDEGYGQPFNEVRWVSSPESLPSPPASTTSAKGRLIVTSPGGIMDSTFQTEDMMDDVEGGRIILFDFDQQFAGQAGQTFSLSLGSSPPQPLEEASVDVATEVAIVRRRTVNQSRNGTLSQRPVPLGRSATQSRGRRPARNGSPGVGMGLAPSGTRRNVGNVQTGGRNEDLPLSDLTETQSVESGGPMEAVEEPYAQNAPRSQASLQRAATNAQRHRYQAIEERTQEQINHPEESAARFLALPEYTEEPNAPLPSRYRAMAGLDGPAQPSFVKQETHAPPRLNTAPSHEDMDLDMRRPAAPRPQNSPGLPEPMSAFAAPLEEPTFPNFSSPRRHRRSQSGGASPPQSSGLQRANTTNFRGHPPTSLSNWRNLSSSSGLAMNNSTSRLDDPSLDTTSPVTARPEYRDSRQSFPSPIGRPQHAPSRTISSTSSFDADGGPRIPPHMQAFRQAAAASPSAPLFLSDLNASRGAHQRPASQLETNPPPVTGWHHPASSPTSAFPQNRAGRSDHHASPSNSNLARSHSRRSQTKSTMTSTKTKKLGLFDRKKAKSQVFREFPEDDGRQSKMETRSVFTMRTKGAERKCIVM